jgi:hypothetical protein
VALLLSQSGDRVATPLAPPQSLRTMPATLQHPTESKQQRPSNLHRGRHAYICAAVRGLLHDYLLVFGSSHSSVFNYGRVLVVAIFRADAQTCVKRGKSELFRCRSEISGVTKLPSAVDWQGL